MVLTATNGHAEGSKLGVRIVRALITEATTLAHFDVEASGTVALEADGDGSAAL